ncbi:MAG: hypothetical protein GX572_05700, partial [Clostridia bacterium]|nr:hypothetical protein [Clostridia bacterium]
KTTRQKIRITSYIAFVAIAMAILNVLIMTIWETRDFFVARQALGAAFWQSAESSVGASNLLMWYLVLAALIILAGIFTAILENETPFTPKVPRRMKLAAILLFGGCEISLWIVWIIFKLMQQNALETQAAEQLMRTMSGRIVGDVLAVVLFCLAYIFEHGFKLQQENDEIL